MFKTRFMFTAAIALVFATPAMAQQQRMPQTGMPNQQQMQQLEVSDATMQQFAKVQQKIKALQKRYQAQAQQSGASEQQTQSMAKKVNQQAVKIVKDSPLSVQQYNQIAMMLPRDSALQEQYRQAIQ